MAEKEITHLVNIDTIADIDYVGREHMAREMVGQCILQSMSSLLIQAACEPDPIRNPRLMAALWPRSGSLTQKSSHAEYFLIISTELSVLPPSSTKSRDSDNPEAVPT